MTDENLNLTPPQPDSRTGSSLSDYQRKRVDELLAAIVPLNPDQRETYLKEHGGNDREVLGEIKSCDWIHLTGPRGKIGELNHTCIHSANRNQ